MNFLRNWLDFFKPLQIKNLQVYWSGLSISLIGMWLQTTAMGILVYRVSGDSATSVGIQAALNAAPFLLGGMALGSLGDRFDRRKLILAIQLVKMVLALTLCLLHATGLLEIWHLYAVSFLLGVSESIAFPSQQAFVGDLVPRSMLSECIAMYSLVFNTCRAVGPPMAGLVLAQWGATVSFGLNAVSFIPLIGCLIALKRTTTSKVKVKHERDSKVKTPSGFNTIISNKYLLFIMINALLQNFFGQSLYQIIPAIAYGDEHATGIILGAIGLGAVISILFLQPFFRLSGRIGLKLTGGVLWMGITILIAGIFPSLYVKSVCFFLAGLATSVLFITASSSVQLLAPPERKTGILGFYTIVSIGVQPLAGLMWGGFMDLFSVPFVLKIVGVSEIFLASVLLFAFPFWRKWNCLEPIRHEDE